MLIKIYEDNPNLNQIRHVAEVMKNGGVIIFPTDTLYAFGCDIYNQQGVEFIAKLKEKDIRKANLSVICDEISQVSEYAKIDDTAFKLIKKNLPGPFTFILNGNNKLPKIFKNKKTVGIRIPDNNIALQLVRELGNPIMASSIFTDEDTQEYITDPELIEEKYGKITSLVIDGGLGGVIPSTVIDCTDMKQEIIREGAGVIK
ncbi:MAG: L-threonylcarbamoyladenylate synthase [Paludibacteraceae bacterium]